MYTDEATRLSFFILERGTEANRQREKDESVIEEIKRKKQQTSGSLNPINKMNRSPEVRNRNKNLQG